MASGQTTNSRKKSVADPKAPPPKRTVMPARKRPAPEPSTDRRRSGRLSTSEQKKGPYFEDAQDSDNSVGPARKQRKVASRRQSKNKEESEDQYEEDRQGDDQDDDDDDDGAPRKVEIIPLEKMRDTGGVDYADYKVHKNTLLFLKDLKANNKRSWLKCELYTVSRPSSPSVTRRISLLTLRSSRRGVQTSSEGLAVVC